MLSFTALLGSLWQLEFIAAEISVGQTTIRQSLQPAIVVRGIKCQRMRDGRGPTIDPTFYSLGFPRSKQFAGQSSVLCPPPPSPLPPALPFLRKRRDGVHFVPPLQTAPRSALFHSCLSSEHEASLFFYPLQMLFENVAAGNGDGIIRCG